MDFDTIDRALGKRDVLPGPPETGIDPAKRDDILRSSLCFPEHDIPRGELADWAIVLLDLDKEVAVLAAVAAVEAARTVEGTGSTDTKFIGELLKELHAWLDGPKGIAELHRLGDLWWSMVRNPPQDADTPLGQATFMAWWVAAYDPEGWGNPPDDPEELQAWLAEAADNKGGIADVFGLVQETVGSHQHGLLVSAVRRAVAEWRDSSVKLADK